jgi:predicted NAD/FAD-binding protein
VDFSKLAYFALSKSSSHIADMSPSKSKKPPKRIAVVGGGISGIACLWGLRDEEHEVHLYESEGRLGGHANSVPFEGNGNVATVDTGFITLNEDMYRKSQHLFRYTILANNIVASFSAFLDTLKVQTIPTDMSFGVSELDEGVEWGSSSFWGFVGSFSRLFSLWFWRLVFDIIRFNFFATDILAEKSSAPSQSPQEGIYEDGKQRSKKQKLESVGEWLARHNYSEQFKRYYIIPLIAAPWCIDPGVVSHNFPAETLILFMFVSRIP